MNHHRIGFSPRRSDHCGVAAVEFALIASVFFTVLFGAIEVSRLLFLWNTTTEATRIGARTAVVCNANAAAIKQKVKTFLPTLSDAEISVTYNPAGCAPGTCESATVKVAAVSAVATFIPFVPLALTLPSATTTLTVESMSSTLAGAGGGANPMCP